jgi:DNA-directed RNA polymerase sigma subunit (sigma70/sigma32)
MVVRLKLFLPPEEYMSEYDKHVETELIGSKFQSVHTDDYPENDLPITDDNGIREDLLYDTDEYILDFITTNDFSEKLYSILGMLDTRSRKVLELRFGLDGDDPKAYWYIAMELHISASRARQITEKALRTLRHPRNSRVLREYLY